METLEAKTRDLSVKGKKLRREGYATGSISGKAMKESLAIIMTQKDLGMFFQDHHVGSEAELSVDGTKYSVLIKSVDFDAMKHQYIDVTFQQLLNDEKIHSKAVIEFINAEKAQGFLTKTCEEVEFVGYPKDLVDHIVIDLAKYPVGTRLTVGDLDIAKEGKLEIKTPLTDTVLHVTAHQHGKAAEVDEPEAPAEITAPPVETKLEKDPEILQELAWAEEIIPLRMRSRRETSGSFFDHFRRVF